MPRRFPTAPARHAVLAIVAIAALAPAALLAPARRAHGGLAESRAANPHAWYLILASNEEPGERFFLEGRAFSLPDSQPISNAAIRVYHANSNGNYAVGGENHSHLDGVVHTNAEGRFFVRTVLPGIAEGSPHVHYVLSGPGLLEKAGTWTLARMHGAGSDTAYSKLPYMLSGDFTWVEPAADGGMHAKCRIYARRSDAH